MTLIKNYLSVILLIFMSIDGLSQGNPEAGFHETYPDEISGGNEDFSGLPQIQKGTIKIGNALINLPDSLIFLGDDYLTQYLTDTGSQTSDIKNIKGIIYPLDFATTGQSDKAFLIEYETPGHVNDDNMNSFNYNKLIEFLISGNDLGISTFKWYDNPGYDSKKHSISIPSGFTNQFGYYYINGIYEVFGARDALKFRAIGESSGIDWFKKYSRELINNTKFVADASYESFPKDSIPTYSSVGSYFFQIKNPKKIEEELSGGNIIYSITDIPKMGWFKVLVILIGVVALLWIINFLLGIKDAESSSLRNRAYRVILRLFLFYTCYILLIFIGVLMVIGAFYLSKWLINGRLGIVLLLIGLFVIWMTLGMFGIYLVKPLFLKKKFNEPERIDISQENAPELFKMVKEIADATGSRMPTNIYLSSDVNAAVNYNPGFWNVLFSNKKSLTIGAPLLYYLSPIELKAVLAHEFGHFSQRLLKLSRFLNASYNLTYNIVNNNDYIDRLVIDWKLSNSWLVFQIIGWINYKMLFTVKNIMTGLFRYIDRSYKGMGRGLEFEADAISAAIVGKEANISVLNKIDRISIRFEQFNELIYKFASSRNLRPSDYWTAYNMFEKYFSKIDNHDFTPGKLWTQEINEDFPSEVKLEDIWNTHPSKSERYKNVDSISCHTTEEPLGYAFDLISHDLKSQISNLILTNRGLQNLEKISDEDFEKLIKDELEESYFPLGYTVFFGRKMMIPENLRIPEESREERKPENPFTKENENKIKEFGRSISDYQILHSFKHKGLPQKKLRFRGKIYNRKNIPLEEIYEEFGRKENIIRNIDREIINYCFAVIEDKTFVEKAFNIIAASDNCLRDLTNALNPRRDWIVRELNLIKRRSPEEVNDIMKVLKDYESVLKDFFKRFHLATLFPVMHVEMYKTLKAFFEDQSKFSSVSNINEEIRILFAIDDDYRLLINHIGYFYKRALIQLLEGLEPQKYWEWSVAEWMDKQSGNVTPPDPELSERDDTASVDSAEETNKTL